jgi:hypothetical protein
VISLPSVPRRLTRVAGKQLRGPRRHPHRLHFGRRWRSSLLQRRGRARGACRTPSLVLAKGVDRRCAVRRRLGRPDQRRHVLHIGLPRKGLEGRARADGARLAARMPLASRLGAPTPQGVVSFHTTSRKRPCKGYASAAHTHLPLSVSQLGRRPRRPDARYQRAAWQRRNQAVQRRQRRGLERPGLGGRGAAGRVWEVALALEGGVHCRAAGSRRGAKGRTCCLYLRPVTSPARCCASPTGAAAAHARRSSRVSPTWRGPVAVPLHCIAPAARAPARQQRGAAAPGRCNRGRPPAGQRELPDGADPGGVDGRELGRLRLPLRSGAGVQLLLVARLDVPLADLKVRAGGRGEKRLRVSTRNAPLAQAASCRACLAAGVSTCRTRGQKQPGPPTAPGAPRLQRAVQRLQPLLLGLGDLLGPRVPLARLPPLYQSQPQRQLRRVVERRQRRLKRALLPGRLQPAELVRPGWG